MAIQQIKVKAALGEKTLDVDYDDSTGLCNGSNKDNWNNLIEFSGSPGIWICSLKSTAPLSNFEVI